MHNALVSEMRQRGQDLRGQVANHVEIQARVDGAESGADDQLHHDRRAASDDLAGLRRDQVGVIAGDRESDL